MNASTSQKCYRGYHQECVSTYQVDEPPYNVISLCDCFCHAKELESAHDAKVRADERERIARAIQRAKPRHLTRDYTPADQAYDDAAFIAAMDPTTALLVADWLLAEATNWAGTVCEDQLPPPALALAEHINGRTT